MKNLKNNIGIVSAFCVLLLIICAPSISHAQRSNVFAEKGCSEVGGNVTFQSVSPIADGVSGDAMTVFSFAPYIAHFVSDGFEIGVTPFSFMSMSYKGSSSSQIMILGSAAYNFTTDGRTYPYLEALFGYTSESDGASSASGFSWGVSGGAKLAIVDHVIVNVSLQYIEITENPNGAVNRFGSNQLTIGAGFSVWL